jgi:hypothetical protein
MVEMSHTLTTPVWHASAENYQKKTGVVSNDCRPLAWSPAANHLPHGSTSNANRWFVFASRSYSMTGADGFRVSNACSFSLLREATNST